MSSNKQIKVAVVFDEVNMDEHRKKMVDSVFHVLSKYYEVQELAFGEHFMTEIKHFDAVIQFIDSVQPDSRSSYSGTSWNSVYGSGPLAHALCIDKSVTKAVLKSYNIPTPEYVLVPQGCKVPEIDFFLQ